MLPRTSAVVSFITPLALSPVPAWCVCGFDSPLAECGHTCATRYSPPSVPFARDMVDVRCPHCFSCTTALVVVSRMDLCHAILPAFYALRVRYDGCAKLGKILLFSRPHCFSSTTVVVVSHLARFYANRPIQLDVIRDSAHFSVERAHVTRKAEKRHALVPCGDRIDGLLNYVHQ